MTPGRYNMICPQGATFSKQLTWTIDDAPVNLSGYTARMQVREKHSSKTVVLNLNSENGRISLGGSDGTINLDVSADDTKNLYAKNYVYDLELVSAGGIVTRLIEGSFQVTPEVTR